MELFRDLTSKPILGPLNVIGVLALAGILGPLILIVTDFTVAFSNPGYDYLRHSISSLAWAPLGWVQTIGFLAIGLLVEVFVAGLLLGIRGVRGFNLGIALLAIFGFGLLVIGAFHTDPANGPYTFEGNIHGIAAKSIFWLFPAASIAIAPSLKASHYWRGLFKYSIGAAVLALGLMVGSIWMPPDFRLFGLFERILVLDEIVWLVIMAVWLLRLSLRSEKRRKSPVSDL
jgi:hypothetical membrane protein